MEQCILETEKITKIYNGKKIIDEVSFLMREGEIYGLVGRNGAGKSTIMKMLSGIIFPDSGVIKKNISMKEIGCMIEQPNLYFDLNAYENLEITRRLYGINEKQAIDNILKEVGLENEKNKKVYQYSMGMKMRLGIAKALLISPKILILDEPLNGLDPIGVEEIISLLHRMNKEKKMTLLISSHMLDELEEIASYYFVIEGGKMKAYVSKEQLSDMKMNKQSVKEVLLKKMR